MMEVDEFRWKKNTQVKYDGLMLKDVESFGLSQEGAQGGKQQSLENGCESAVCLCCAHTFHSHQYFALYQCLFIYNKLS